MRRSSSCATWLKSRVCFGAYLHAQRAAAGHVRIDAVFNNDIVGNDKGGNGIVDGATIRVYSEGPEDSPSRELARFVQRWGARYVPSHRVRLIARPDRFNRGGDHTAYNQLGFAAVGFRESRENFTRQHDPRDTFEGLSPPYLAQNARVNAAAAGTLALAPPAPEVNRAGGTTIARGPSGYDANLKWGPSPGAAAYRIFWREAWGPDWQHDLLVGNVTEAVLPNVQIDDYVFGVAAVDAAGHEKRGDPTSARRAHHHGQDDSLNRRSAIVNRRSKIQSSRRPSLRAAMKSLITSDTRCETSTKSIPER